MKGRNQTAGPDFEVRREPDQGLKPGMFARLAWLPIPILALAIIAGRVAGLTESYKSEALTLILSFTFYTLVSLGTLLLIGRSFLESGRPGLLLLECGVVLWSLAGTVGDAVSHGNANVNVTIFNTGILLAGLCHLAGAILSLRPQRPVRARPLWLGAACALALGALGLVTQAALAGWLPVFFIPGQGGTPVRYCVLITAIAMFSVSAAMWLSNKRAAHAPFTSWYAYALLLLAVGLFGVMIQLSLGSVVNWLGRTAQWLGGFYLLLAAVAAVRESDLPLLLPEDKPRPDRYRYGVAIAIVLAAAAVRLVFLPALGMRAAFLTFYPAVMLASMYGGLRTGLVATVLSAIIADYFWIEPAGRLGVGNPSDWLSLVIFLLSGFMIAWVSEAMHRARARASEAETQALLAAEREKAAEVLRRSEGRYHTLFTGMTEGFAISELLTDEAGNPVDYRFLDINPAFERLTGLNGEDVVGRTHNEVLPGDDPKWLQMFSQVVLTGQSVQFDNYDPILKRHYEVLAYRTAPMQFAVIFMDITERKQAEKAMRENEERLRFALETIHIGAWDLDLVDHTAFRSLEHDRIFGYSEPLPEWTYEMFLDHVVPEDRAAVDDKFQRAMEQMSDWNFECRIRRADGQFRWVWAAGRHAQDAEGATRRMAGIVQDITDRKQVEEELRRSRDELELRVLERTEALRRQADLIELSHDSIIVRDLESRILFWSNGAEETYGWTKAEAQGNVTHSFLKTIWPVPFDEHMKVLVREGRWEGELVHTRKDGSRLTVLSRQALQRDEAGAAAAILEINIDITDRKQAENETKKYAARLESSNRELQDFAFVASHDLQEPLRKIQAFGDQLKTDYSGSLGEEGADYLKRMQNAAVRMQALIQALLNYSRVTSRAKPFSAVDLAASAREAVSNLEASIRDTGGRVEIEELATIDADPVQMVQLFQNLIGNALKFHGKERPAVKVYGLPSEADEKKGRSRVYKVYVEDNGIGFDEKYLDRIFTPFQRLHGRGVYEGTGIGLAICRKIVDRHGGNITAGSIPGKGTTFIVGLPVKQSKGEKHEH